MSVGCSVYIGEQAFEQKEAPFNLAFVAAPRAGEYLLLKRPDEKDASQYVVERVHHNPAGIVTPSPEIIVIVSPASG